MKLRFLFRAALRELRCWISRDVRYGFDDKGPMRGTRAPEPPVEPRFGSTIPDGIKLSADHPPLPYSAEINAAIEQQHAAMRNQMLQQMGQRGMRGTLMERRILDALSKDFFGGLF